MLTRTKFDFQGTQHATSTCSNNRSTCSRWLFGPACCRRHDCDVRRWLYCGHILEHRDYYGAPRWWCYGYRNRGCCSLRSCSWNNWKCRNLRNDDWRLGNHRSAHVSWHHRLNASLGASGCRGSRSWCRIRSLSLLHAAQKAPGNPCRRRSTFLGRRGKGS